MKAQLFNLETKFSFGKHKGKSLREVLYDESRYVGWLIAVSGDPRFVLDLDIIKQLDEEGFFVICMYQCQTLEASGEQKAPRLFSETKL